MVPYTILGAAYMAMAITDRSRSLLTLFGAARDPRRRKAREETSGKETVERVCRATDFSTNRIAQKA